MVELLLDVNQTYIDLDGNKVTIISGKKDPGHPAFSKYIGDNERVYMGNGLEYKLDVGDADILIPLDQVDENYKPVRLLSNHLYINSLSDVVYVIRDNTVATWDGKNPIDSSVFIGTDGQSYKPNGKNFHSDLVDNTPNAVEIIGRFEYPTVDDTVSLSLEIGHSYYDTDGQVVEIVMFDGTSSTYVLGDNNVVYSLDGNSVVTSCTNLVSEVPPSGLILELGKTYKNKQGDLVKITQLFNLKTSINIKTSLGAATLSFGFAGSDNFVYSVDGRGIPTTIEQSMAGLPYALVEEAVDEDLLREIVADRMSTEFDAALLEDMDDVSLNGAPIPPSDSQSSKVESVSSLELKHENFYLTKSGKVIKVTRAPVLSFSSDMFIGSNKTCYDLDGSVSHYNSDSVIKDDIVAHFPLPNCVDSPTGLSLKVGKTYVTRNCRHVTITSKKDRIDVGGTNFIDRPAFCGNDYRLYFANGEVFGSSTVADPDQCDHIVSEKYL